MSVLEISANSALSMNTFSVAHNGSMVGQIDRQWSGTGAVLMIGGTTYDAGREGLLSATYYLEANGKRIATAQRPSLFRRRFVVQTGGKTYTLATTSLFALSLVLTENDMQIGAITRYVTREMKGEFPDAMALELQAFLIWLAMLLVRGFAFPILVAQD
jgi:hypothetical protein